MIKCARPTLVPLQTIADRVTAGGWCVEPKLDGTRMLVIDGLCVSRHGKQMAWDGDNLLPPGIWDGELVAGQQYYLFDVLRIENVMVAQEPTERRYAHLADVVGGLVHIMPRYLDLDQCMRDHGTSTEGLVAKMLGKPYPYGDTPYWVKHRWPKC